MNFLVDILSPVRRPYQRIFLFSRCCRTMVKTPRLPQIPSGVSHWAGTTKLGDILVLNTIHTTLDNIHCTLYTLHRTIYTVHYTHYTGQYTLYTGKCTLYTVHNKKRSRARVTIGGQFVLLQNFIKIKMFDVFEKAKITAWITSFHTCFWTHDFFFK